MVAHQQGTLPPRVKSRPAWLAQTNATSLRSSKSVREVLSLCSLETKVLGAPGSSVSPCRQHAHDRPRRVRVVALGCVGVCESNSYGPSLSLSHRKAGANFPSRLHLRWSLWIGAIILSVILEFKIRNLSCSLWWYIAYLNLEASCLSTASSHIQWWGPTVLYSFHDFWEMLWLFSLAWDANKLALKVCLICPSWSFTLLIKALQ